MAMSLQRNVSDQGSFEISPFGRNDKMLPHLKPYPTPVSLSGTQDKPDAEKGDDRVIRFSLKRFCNRIIQLVFLAGLLASISTSTAYADLGMKPEMEFKFVTEDPQQSFSIQSATLYECQQADCSDAQPIDEIGPQRLICQNDVCTIYFYGLEPYYRLEASFGDGRTLNSRAFAPSGFHSYYTVVVRENDLLVKSRFAFDLFASPICLSVCGSLWLAVFWVLVALFGKYR